MEGTGVLGTRVLREGEAVYMKIESMKNSIANNIIMSRFKLDSEGGTRDGSGGIEEREDMAQSRTSSTPSKMENGED